MNGLEFFTHVYPDTSPLTVFDVGAHIGESGASFLRLFPHAHIHAFEPAPENHRRLKERFARIPSVTVHAVAVGDRDGTAKLHLNSHDATHSLLPVDVSEIDRWADSADIRESKLIEVQQRSIDSLLTELGLDKIDILKLDVQGGELLVLQGAIEALRANRVGCIFAEVEFRALYAGQPLAWDIHRFLAGAGYQFINFCGPKVTDGGLLSWADAIYANAAIWSRLASRHTAGKMHSNAS